MILYGHGWERNGVQLLSVVGHVATVVKLGRTFMQCLFDLSKMVSHPDHHVHLSVGVTSDLAWWHLFLESWNGSSLMTDAHRILADIIFNLTSDAWRCGVHWGDKWFQLA